MITVMASAAVSPALANISRAFPEASTSLIKTILTLPSLFIIPFSLISGKLVYRFGNKRILIFGILIYIIGGIAPVYVDTIPQLLFFRAILGCGSGLIMPISQALIAIHYEGPQRTKITGYSGAASYLMGVIASFFVAPISSINWHYSFYIYLVAIVVLGLNIALLPADKPSQSTQKQTRKKFPASVWWIIVGVLLVNIAFYAVPANVALFMKEQQIGESESAGIVISVFMIAGFFAGLILYYIQYLFKKYTVVFGVAIMALGYTILSFSYDMLTVVAGAGFVGFSFGVLFPSFLILITGKCSTNSCILALSIMSCFQFLGQFLSPYVLQLIKNILRLSSLRYDFIILSFSLIVAVIIYIVIKQIMEYQLKYRSFK